MLTIPYFEVSPIGPFQPWGLLVATGVAISVIWAIKRGQRFNLDIDALTSLAILIVIGGFIGARLVHVCVYNWSDFYNDPSMLLKMGKGGFSSFGGFLGSATAGILYIRQKKLNAWLYGDVAIFSIIPGWIVGRVGCFVIHDHPGKVTDFLLGVEMKISTLANPLPHLSARHDLGLYDALLTASILVVFLALDRKARSSGFFVGLACILYSVPRFFLDFLRATDLSWADTRYLGLTPAQYGSIILLTLGGWIFWAHKQDAT